MLKVYSSAILMVLGMVAVVPQPLAGMAMLGAGIWLFLSTTPPGLQAVWVEDGVIGNAMEAAA